MKFSLASIIAASCVACGSAFVVKPSSSVGSRTSSVVLDASRRRQKIASRSKWLEARGMSDVVATTEPASASGTLTNAEGLEFVRLVSENGSSAEVYLYGGVVTSYKDAEGTEFIAVRPDAKMDGSKPISGGLSHCWPQVSLGIIIVVIVMQQNRTVLTYIVGFVIILRLISLDPVRFNNTDSPEMSCGLSSPRTLPA